MTRGRAGPSCPPFLRRRSGWPCCARRCSAGVRTQRTGPGGRADSTVCHYGGTPRRAWGCR
eukprot:12579878-Alexandrium_andersonii.AAC.1